MEKPMTEVSSRGCLLRGKPSSTRSGPKGDIQRPPTPTDLLRSAKLKPLENALPISKNATPRSPYCSAIGNISSALNPAAVSPPITSPGTLISSKGSQGVLGVNGCLIVESPFL